MLKPGVLTGKQLDEITKIPYDSPTETQAAVIAAIRRGEHKVLKVSQEGKEVGFTVYSVIENERGAEFLSVVSWGQGVSLTEEVIPLLEDIARQLGCRSMRLHTCRPGLIEKLLKQNWFCSEIIMRKAL